MQHVGPVIHLFLWPLVVAYRHFICGCKLEQRTNIQFCQQLDDPVFMWRIFTGGDSCVCSYHQQKKQQYSQVSSAARACSLFSSFMWLCTRNLSPSQTHTVLRSWGKPFSTNDLNCGVMTCSGPGSCVTSHSVVYLATVTLINRFGSLWLLSLPQNEILKVAKLLF